MIPENNQAIRLLVVDDELNIRSPLVLMLNSFGYSVDEAASGQEALNLLSLSSYDLMLLDLRLPDLDGITVMHNARQLYPDLLIVIMTGCPTLESAIEALRLKAANYLSKPISMTEIAEAITQALHRTKVI